MATPYKKTFITYLCIVGAILIILNIVSRNIFFRWDLTDNKMYSLSDSSKSVVEKIEDRLIPVLEESIKNKESTDSVAKRIAWKRINNLIQI